MSDVLEANIQFIINNPEVKAQADQVKTYIKDIAKTSDAEIARVVKANISDKESRDQVILALKAEKDALIELEKIKKRQQEINDNSAKSTRGLAMGINQITRELPAFTYSAQTGFMGIANNIPILVDEVTRLSKANKELTAGGGKAVPVWKQLVSGMFSWQTLLSVGITLMTVYGKEIGNFLTSLFKGKDAINAAKESIRLLNDAVASTDWKKAYTGIAELKTNIDLAKKGFIDKKDVVDQYNKTIGQTIGQVKSLDEVESAIVKNGDAYIKMTLFKAAANLALEEAAKKAFEAEQNRLKKESDFEKTADGATPVMFSSGGMSVNLEANQQAEERAKRRAKERKEARIKELTEEQQAFENIAKSFQTRAAKISATSNFDFYGDAGSDATGDKTKQQKEAAARKAAEAARQKQENEFLRAIEGRKGVLDKMAALDAEYARKSLTKDEEELQALKDKFAAFRKILESENEKIQRYNLTHKKKVAEIDIKQVLPIEAKATEDLKAKQGVEAEKNTIAQQKQLFEQYEAFKLEFGAQKADERFRAELSVYKDYVSYIKGQLQSLSGKNDAGSNALKDFFNSELPKAEKEANNKAFDNQLKNLKRILAATKTAKSEELRINEQYDKDLATLRADTSLNSEDLAIREQKLADARALELKVVKELAFAESALYKDAMADVTDASLKELLQRIADAKRELQNANLTPEQRAAANGKLDKATNELGGRGIKKDEFGQLIRENAKGVDQAKKIAAYADAASGSFYEMAAALKDIAPGTADTLETMGDIAGVAANAAGAVASFASGDIVGGIKGTISAIAGVFAIGAKARESELKAQAELEEMRFRAWAGELDYNQVLRERLVLLSKAENISLANLKAQREALLLAKQQNEADDKRVSEEFFGDKEKNAQILAQAKAAREKGIAGIVEQAKLMKQITGGQYISDTKTEKYGGFLGIGRKTRTVNEFSSLAGKTYEEVEEIAAKGLLEGSTLAIFENLKKLKEEGKSLDDQLKELEKQAKEILTGTDVASLSNTFMDGLLGGFETATQGFEDMMRKAILNSVQYGPLAAELEKFYENYAVLAGDGISKDDIDILRNAYKKLFEESDKELENLAAITGIDLKNKSNSKSTVSNAIQGITATEANLLAGQFGGQRIATLEGNAIATANGQTMQQQTAALQKQVLLQEEIAANTANTVVEVRNAVAELKELNKNVADNSAAGRALGFP